MKEELDLLEAIAPDMMETLQERFLIMQNLYWMAPVGRRMLALHMNLTERSLRTETDFLKKQNLITASKSGMELTTRGNQIYHSLETLMKHTFGIKKQEQQLAAYFHIAKCLIAAGDSDLQPKIVETFGTMASDALDYLLPEKENIIAVMGGTTMATVAENMTRLETVNRHNMFVPARGGIGEAIAVQANSISERMASKTGGDYRTLYVPERVSPATYRPLLQEPSVQSVLDMIQRANCVVHSIGDAMFMAERRHMTTHEIAMLHEKKAVAESFGYFFDSEGKVVYKLPVIGLQLKALTNIPVVLAIAGGSSKAESIQAYMKNAPQQTWLITDEAAANEILKGATL